MSNGLSNGTQIGERSNLINTPWIDFSEQSTIVGWSSFTIKKIYTKTIGKTVFVSYYLSGTSNATTSTFTLPYACENTITRYFSQGYSSDNGTPSDGIGYIVENKTTVDLRSTRSEGSWTNSGTKICNGQFFYERQ